MKNKLTKQYHKGTLPCGFYYFKNSVEETYTVEYGNHGIKGCKDVEVLSEVPSFEEYEKLKKKLDIAVKGLKTISSQCYGKDMYDCAKGTLKLLEELENES